MLIVSAGVEGACGKLGTDLTQVIALEVTVADSVAEADTLRAHAIARSARGDSVTAAISWASLDTSFLAAVDSTSGEFVGKQPGTARIQAYSGSLRSNPISIRVYAPGP